MSKKVNTDSRHEAGNINTDGWQNLFTKSGFNQYDKKANKQFKINKTLGEYVLDDLYEGEGLGSKIIDVYPLYALKEGFVIEGDPENQILDVYENLKLFKPIKRSLIIDRIHGGSLIFFGLNDGGDAEDEVNLDRLDGIEFTQVYDRWRVQWYDEDLQTDINKPRYNEPEFYRITPINGQEFKVHYSRTYILDGLQVSDRVRNTLRGWGNPVFQEIFTKLSSCMAVFDNVEDVTYDFMQTIIKMDNLQQMIYSDQIDKVRDRMNIIDEGRSTMHTIMLDTKEDYTKSSSSVAGLPQVMQEYYIMLAAVSRLPVTLLMGRSPAGENATGQADFESFYGWVEAYQLDKVQGLVEFINQLIINSKAYKIKLPENGTLKVIFKPIKKPDPKELSEINTKKIEDYSKLIDRNVLLPEEVLWLLNNDKQSGVYIDINKRKELLNKMESIENEEINNG